MSLSLAFPAWADDLGLSYESNVSFEPESRTIQGTETLRWRNDTSQTIDSVPIHLYLNAFRSEASTWMREQWLGSSRLDTNEVIELFDDPWGSIDLESVVQAHGDETLDCRYEFIQPDDGNIHDQTLARVTLAQPVPPGQTLELRFKFTSRLPIPFARTGGRDDYFHVGQWFPKIGVYDTQGWAAR